MLLGSAAWLRTLTTHYAAALRLDGAYKTTRALAPQQLASSSWRPQFRSPRRLRTLKHAPGASEGLRRPQLAFSWRNRPSGIYEDANLSPRGCKWTPPVPLRPKAHLATSKSASGPLRRRRARPDHPKASKIQQKVRLPGQGATPNQTHIRSVHVAPALVPARGIRQQVLARRPELWVRGVAHVQRV